MPESNGLAIIDKFVQVGNDVLHHDQGVQGHFQPNFRPPPDYQQVFLTLYRTKVSELRDITKELHSLARQHKADTSSVRRFMRALEDHAFMDDRIAVTWSAARDCVDALRDKVEAALTHGGGATGRVDAEEKPAAVDGGTEQTDADTRLPPSRIKARSACDWALSNINDADKMTIAELHKAIMEHPQGPTDCIPDNAAAFGKYLREAGVKKYDAKGARRPRPSRSVRPHQQI